MLKLLCKSLPIILLIQPLLATAVTVYDESKAPYNLKQKGNPYQAGNPYDNKNNTNPYSEFRNPYNPKSVFNNPQQHTSPANSFTGKYQGSVSPSTKNENSLTNPYGAYGNRYSVKNPSAPYNKIDNGNHPYSQYRSPYAPNSVFNASKFPTQVHNNNGSNLGSLQSGTYYNKQSVLNPYSKNGNPYLPGNLANPYSHNPYSHNYYSY